MNAHGFFKRGLLASAILFGVCGGAFAERLALVVGNNDYTHVSKLQKAVGDARAVKQALERLGFKVTLIENVDHRRFGDALDTFEAKVSSGDEVVVHYSGHGISMDGRNFLLPIDIEDPQPGQERRVQRSAYDAGEVVEAIRAKDPKFVFAILDACRNNPFEGAGRSIGATRGLARIEAEPGAFFLFSAGPGETALDRLSDSDESTTSVFTRVLVKQLATPGLTLQGIAKATQRDVRTLALSVEHRQFPDYSDRTADRLVLLPGPPPAAQKQPGSDTAFRLALLDGSDAALRDVLGRFPDHPRAGEVLDRLEARADDTAFAKAEKAATLEAYQAYLDRPGAQRHADRAKTAVARLAPETRTAKKDSAATAPRPPTGPTPIQLLVGPDTRDAYVTAAAVSSDSRMVAADSRDGGSIRVWDFATGHLIHTLVGHSMPARFLAFSPDGRMLASGSPDQSVRLWDVSTGELLRVMQVKDGNVQALAFSPDGRYLASGDTQVQLWDAASGELVRTFESGPKGAPRALVFSRDGRTLVSGETQGKVSLWDVTTGQLRRSLQAHSGHTSSITVGFVADDTLLVTHTDDGFAKIWDAATGALLRTFIDAVSAVAVSSDGRTILTVDRKRLLNSIDPATGKVARTLQQLQSPDLGEHLRFSGDGRLLIMSTIPGTLWVREAASGRALAKFLPLPDGEGAAITDQGYVASAGADQHLYVSQGGYRVQVDGVFKKRWLKEALSAPAIPTTAGNCSGGVTC